MNCTINRPEQCPHRSPGYCYMDLCNHPGAPKIMYCDTSESAIRADKFPGNCPLRRRDVC